MGLENLSQDEAEKLISTSKRYSGNKESWFPSPGELLEFDLVSTDQKEYFLLSIRSGRIELQKVSSQLRVRKIHVLLRLDLGNKPHTNPDGEKIEGPHLHRYREGYGDKFAIPLPRDIFTDPTDSYVTIQEFMTFCNIIHQPIISKRIDQW